MLRAGGLATRPKHTLFLPTISYITSLEEGDNPLFVILYRPRGVFDRRKRKYRTCSQQYERNPQNGNESDLYHIFLLNRPQHFRYMEYNRNLIIL